MFTSSRNRVGALTAAVLVVIALGGLAAGNPAEAAIKRCAVPGGGQYVPARVKPPEYLAMCVPKAAYHIVSIPGDLVAAQNAGIRRCLRIWQSTPTYHWLSLSERFPFYTGFLPGPVNVACVVLRWNWVYNY